MSTHNGECMFGMLIGLGIGIFWLLDVRPLSGGWGVAHVFGWGLGSKMGLSMGERKVTCGGNLHHGSD